MCLWLLTRNIHSSHSKLCHLNRQQLFRNALSICTFPADMRLSFKSTGLDDFILRWTTFKSLHVEKFGSNITSPYKAGGDDFRRRVGVCLLMFLLPV